MTRFVVLAVGFGLLVVLGMAQASLGQPPELVPIQCNQTLEEAASCSGPFIICARQYTIEVPEGATKMVIDLRPRSGADANWDLDLFVNRGEPVDQGRLDSTVIAFSDDVGPDTITLPSGDLEPGTYYIAIGNANEAPQPYELTVTLDPCKKCSVAQEQSAGNAIPLKPDRTETGLAAAATLAERQYMVEITKDTRAFALGLRSESGGNIDLYIQLGCALEAGSQQTIADFSLVSPVGFEFLVIKGAQLKPGTYYLAVENRESTEQQFSIAATVVPVLSEPFTTDGSADGRVESQGQGLLAFLQRLLQTEGGRLAPTQYVLEVESGVKTLSIDMEGSGTLHLHVRFERPVEIDGGRVIADLSSLGQSGVKSITLGGVLLKPGRYFVAIEGLATEPQDFIVRFTFERDGSAVTATKRYANPPHVKVPSEIQIEQ